MALTDPVAGLPLHGQRVALTALEATDQPALLPFFQDMASLAYFIPTTARPLNAPQLKYLLDDWNDGIENFVFAIRLDGRLIGMVNLDGLDWPNGHSEIGIALTERGERGRGLAAEALALLIRYAFDELGLNRIWAQIIEDNLPSIHLFEALGFQPEGRMRQHVRRRGQYRDMLIYGLIRSV
jgi:RimJ/RimL family protein N-acetyltransferase